MWGGILRTPPGRVLLEVKTGPIEMVEILADRAREITGQFSKKLGEQGEEYSAGGQATTKTLRLLFKVRFGGSLCFFLIWDWKAASN